MTNAHQFNEKKAKRKKTMKYYQDNVEDGCGCTEIWEHMSEERESESASDD